MATNEKDKKLKGSVHYEGKTILRIDDSHMIGVIRIYFTDGTILTLHAACDSHGCESQIEVNTEL